MSKSNRKKKTSKIKKKDKELSIEAQLITDLIEEVKGTKRLMAVLLIKLGSDSSELGAALNVDSSTIRHTFSIKDFSRIKLTPPKTEE